MPETNVQETHEVAPVVEVPSAPETQPAVDTWTDGTPFDAKRAKELVSKYEAEAKEGRKVAKRLADLEAKEKERADAELSELDKANKRIAELEAQTKAQAFRELQNKVAEKVGLPAAFASRIQGETEELMVEDAKTLLAAMPTKVAPKLGPTNPGEPQTGETEADKRKRLLG